MGVDKGKHRRLKIESVQTQKIPDRCLPTSSGTFWS